MTRWRLPGGLRLWVGGGSLLLVAIALWTHGQEVLALAPHQRGWALLLLGLSLTVAAQWANGLAWWALLRWLQLPLPLVPLPCVAAPTQEGRHLAPQSPAAARRSPHPIGQAGRVSPVFRPLVRVLMRPGRGLARRSRQQSPARRARDGAARFPAYSPRRRVAQPAAPDPFPPSSQNHRAESQTRPRDRGSAPASQKTEGCRGAPSRGMCVHKA